ncbi:MAG: hydrogenase expression/formation protein HypE [Candidatus Lokiarchaeota archaeon]|nr:hydrogenase expression/formation protein HypE [Candidatus Lokiarchaeota archaeon]
MTKFEKISLAHGAGGKIMADLLRIITASITEKNLVNGIGLKELDDGGTIPLETQEMVITADAHTVDPIFFPGGDIGRLAVSGTVNDVLMMGAVPLVITDTIVVEEGFETSELKKILDSMNETAKEAGVKIIAGDFKVVPKGKLDKIMISTSGVGIVEKGKVILDSGLKPGNKIIITGTIGDHGTAILALREGMEFETTLKSDTRPLTDLILTARNNGKITAMKDPTRGGISSALNEIAEKSGVSIVLNEIDLPIRQEVKTASEIFGIEPLDITCEGIAIIGVESNDANKVLESIKNSKYGENARIIGEVKSENPGKVILKTLYGSHRIIDMPPGEPIPRVC